jgi:cysteine-rich repeat protein
VPHGSPARTPIITRRGSAVLAAFAASLGSAGASAATPQDQQFSLANAGAIKIVVRSPGWVHVGQPALAAAGLPASVDPTTLQLFADGVEQAIEVTGNGDAAFTSGEGIEFYGLGRDTLWTNAHTYWLVAGVAGARVLVQAANAGAIAPANFVHAERLVERKMYLASVLNGDESNFFAAAISSMPTMETIAAHNLDASAVGTAVLRVRLQGVTSTAHAVDVSFNGQLLGTCALDPTAEATFSFPTPNVVEGDNQLTLTSEGASDYTALESVELDYAHTYAADGDALAFTAPAGTRVAITGFSTSSVRVVDVTDATQPIELVVTTPTAGTARVDTPAGAGPRTFYAFSTALVASADSITADVPSSWAGSHDGDLLILSHASFMSALAPLVAQRKKDGFTVQLADLQDVYDEFGGGDKTVDAIRGFVQWTRTHWRVPPRFVLLVGDATFDPRNFLGLGDFDFAPTKLIDTSTMETASDDWYVDADLDGIPEIAIGRMPVRTADEATAVVQKTLAYAGRADLPRGGLFVTDVNDSDVDFEAASALSATKVSDIMPTSQFARSDPASTSDALVAKLNGGPFLVNYFGHGSVEVWDGLLSGTQASALTNASSSIYVIMNCLNGFFQDLYTTSLAESLLENSQGGAVAVWASSTLADFTFQPAFNQEFLMRLTRTSLGEAATSAKQAITDLETRRTWILFGDPTLFGAPLPASDGGASDGATDAVGGVDASSDGATDASAADGGARADSGATMDAAADAAVTEASVDIAADGAAVADANGETSPVMSDAAVDATDGSTTPAPSSAGCGCAFDKTPAASFGGVGLLALGIVVAAGRARPRRRREPRRARRWPLGLLSLTVAWLAWAPGAQASYGYRKPLTIDRTRIGNTGGATTLTNYPLLINMTDTVLINDGMAGHHVTSANGYDIAFTGADSVTCGGPTTCTFNYEIESYNGATGQVIAWVQIPGLNTVANTTNTVIYIKYGDATITSPTQNVNGTWDTNFKGVWHLSQNPGGTAPQETDSTSTGANATSNGSPAATSAVGLISSGVNMSSTTGTAYFDYRSTTFNWLSTDSFTYSGWFNTSDGGGPLLSQRDVSGRPVIDVMIGYDGVTRSANNLLTLVRDDTGGTYAEVVGGTSVNDNAWHLFTLTRTSGTIQLYLDGISVGTSTNAGASSTITTGALGNFQNIGREGNWVSANYGNASADDRYLAGTFDEYRISKSIRSSDWITTDYNTQFAPTSTFTAGSESLASCGDGVVGTGEACDDGNIVSGDGCSGTCTIETGYTCSGMPSSCHTTCGDGIVAGSEGCDDGNTVSGDGCSSTCTVESTYHCSGSPSVCVVATFAFLKTITVNKAQVGTGTAPTTLTNYPVLVSITGDTNLKSTGHGGNVQSTSGYDIMFQGRDATTCGGPTACQLAHEIEAYDPVAGTFVAWVKVPGLKTQTNAASTTFNMLYDNAAITTTTEEKTSVWDSNFMAVWHLNQASGSMSDSTSNANTGTNTALTSTAGEVSNGVSADGSTSFMSFNSGSSLNVSSGAGFTYSAWVNTSDAFGALYSLRNSTNSQSVIDVMLGFDGVTTSSGTLLAYARDNGGTGVEVNGGTLTTSVWHLVTFTRNGTTMTLYVDKTSVGSGTGSSNAITTDTRNLGREGYWTADAPGYTTVGNEFLAATLDEARISSTNRSLDWITTDYNSQFTPASFITVGAQTATTIHTDVQILSFEAQDQCAGTELAWQTADELDTLGFNVYREVDGERMALNPTLIPGAGLAGGGSHPYTFIDPGAHDANRTYLLEQVGFDLEGRWYGPVAPAAATACPSAASASVTPSSAVVSLPGGVPTPSATSAPGAVTDVQSGGCSITTKNGGGVAALLAAAMIALARRRRAG